MASPSDGGMHSTVGTGPAELSSSVDFPIGGRDARQFSIARCRKTSDSRRWFRRATCSISASPTCSITSHPIRLPMSPFDISNRSSMPESSTRLHEPSHDPNRSWHIRPDDSSSTQPGNTARGRPPTFGSTAAAPPSLFCDRVDNSAASVGRACHSTVADENGVSISLAARARIDRMSPDA